MQRVVVLGRCGAGKSTAARTLGRRLGIPVIELDKEFWTADLTPMPRREWAARQAELAATPAWVMDGDLGPYDVLAPRLARAEMVIILDFGLLRCAWRAARRSRERWDFWWWVITWRRRHRPAVLAAVNESNARLFVCRSPRELRTFLDDLPGA